MRFLINKILRFKYHSIMYNYFLPRSHRNIYTEKSDYAKVSAIPHDTLTIITDIACHFICDNNTLFVVWYLSEYSHQHSVTRLKWRDSWTNEIWTFQDFSYPRWNIKFITSRSFYGLVFTKLDFWIYNFLQYSLSLLI